jgi:hypothetical protein
MSSYSRKLSETFSNRGPKDGFCAICRTFGPLTKDHVPPKECGNVRDAVMRGVYGEGHKQSKKLVISQGSSHFRTICQRCNNTLLGSKYDPALCAVVKEIQSCITRAFESRLALPATQHFDYQPNRFARAVLGRLLASNAISDVAAPKPEAPLDAALRKYVLNFAEGLPSNISIYYWLYPYRRRVIMKHCAMAYQGVGGDPIYGQVFKFWPFGFWVVQNS